jgi:hypothetical protein
MIYRAFCYRPKLASRSDAATVFIDADDCDGAERRLRTLLSLLWQCGESEVDFYNLCHENTLRFQSLRSDDGARFLLEIGSTADRPVYCRDPLLLVGPESMTRLRAALDSLPSTPTAKELEQTAGRYTAMRRVEIDGRSANIAPYLNKHRPQNQMLVEGVPLNPTLHHAFHWNTSEHRDPVELDDWWMRPYVVSENWVARESSERYRRDCELEEGLIWTDGKVDFDQWLSESNEAFEHDLAARKAYWYAHFPEGIRYRVQMLGDSAGKFWGNYDRLSDAVRAAKVGEPMGFLYAELPLHLPPDEISAADA